jgi:hypothetical protein
VNIREASYQLRLRLGHYIKLWHLTHVHQVTLRVLSVNKKRNLKDAATRHVNIFPFVVDCVIVVVDCATKFAKKAIRKRHIFLRNRHVTQLLVSVAVHGQTPQPDVDIAACNSRAIMTYVYAASCGSRGHGRTGG